MTTLSESLAGAPDEWEAPADDEGRERFRIRNDRMCAWGVRKLAEALRRQAQVKAVRDAEVARVDAWAKAESGKFDRDVAYFTAILSEYALDVRDVEDRKSVSTPYGVVQTREGGGGWEVSDEAALIAWAKASRPDLVKVTESFSLADAKRTLEAADGGVVVPTTGETVPGLKVRPTTVTASVKVAPAVES